MKDWNDPKMIALRKQYEMDRDKKAQYDGLFEMMRMTGVYNMTTGNIEIETGTIDIPYEIVEPKQLEP